MEKDMEAKAMGLMITYFWGNKLGYSDIDLLESLLGIFQLSEKRMQKRLRAVYIVFGTVVAVHAVLVIRITLNI
jgi:hypothetical protein